MKMYEIKRIPVLLIMVIGMVWAGIVQGEMSFTKRLVNPNKLQKQGKNFFNPKLYLVDDDSVVHVKTGKYLAERVYALYLKGKKSWFFALTNKRGKFVKPLEIIYFNTVIPGKYLGAKNPYQHYRFTRNWKWKPTKKKVEYFSWVLSKPQVFKRTMYLSTPKKGNK